MAKRKRLTIVAVGASAGGLEALKRLFDALPPKTGLAFVVIQHLSPDAESQLAALLQQHTRMKVEPCGERSRLAPDRVLVAPPRTELSLVGSEVRAVICEPRHASSRPIDAFFKSLADDENAECVGVVLSGTGSDGTSGLRRIKASGGVTFAQDPETAGQRAMPESAIAAGAADFILSPELIARELVRIAKHPVHRDGVDVAVRPREPALERVFGLLREAKGVDFSYYKPSTIRRRIARRMVVHKVDGLAKYEQLLRKDPAEIAALYDDLLINVTGFFRDPASFEALKTHVFPAIVRAVPPGAPIRVWVPGCSTGEEAYSLAIALLEYLGDRAASRPIQIFATDVSEGAIEKARAGVYSERACGGISAQRLKKHFTPIEGGYQVAKKLREMCVFARQNVVKDPPFANVHLISCRNLLIYLGSVLQERVIPIFHAALKPGGFLILGGSEAANRDELFACIEKRSKIYVKKASSNRAALDYIGRDVDRRPAGAPPPPTEITPDLSLRRMADNLLLSRYAPAGVLVDERSQILQFRGRTSAFLEPSHGRASLNLFSMLREDLRPIVRPLLAKALKGAAAESGPLEAEHEGRAVRFVVEAVPLVGAPEDERVALVLFKPLPPPPPDAVKRLRPLALTESAQVSRLQRELEATRELMRTAVEDLESSNQALKAANEEVLSSNEELQSTNEELETAKEEIQASNEELNSLNAELQERNALLARTTSDLQNLLKSSEIPFVTVGVDARIRLCTPSAQALLGLSEDAAGRKLDSVPLRVAVPTLSKITEWVLKDGEPREREVQDLSGRWHRLHVKATRTAQDAVDGAVLAFVDIDVLRRKSAELAASEEALRKQSIILASMVRELNEGLIVVSAEGHAIVFNPAAQRITGLKAAEVLRNGWSTRSLAAHRADGKRIAHEALPLSRALRGERVVDEEQRLPNGRWVSASASPIRDSDGRVAAAVLGYRDVTEERAARERDSRLAAIVESSGDALYSVDTRGNLTSWNKGAEQLYGYAAREVLGRPVSLLWPVDERRRLLAAFAQVLKGTPYRLSRDRRLAKSGRPLVASAAMFPIRDESGKVTGVSIVSRDASSDYERERLERRFQALTAAAPDAILLLDAKGAIRSWNRGAHQLFGFTEQEALGRPVSLVLPELRGRGALERVLEIGSGPGGGAALEMAAVHRAGTRFSAEVAAYGWREDDGMQYAAIIRDLSLRKRAEEADRLRESERLQRDFVANVSHELRTPVAAIRGFAETLLRGAIDDADSARNFVKIIESHALRLSELIEDLLHLSVLESGRRRPRLKKVRLDALLRRCAASLAPLLRARGQTLRISVDPKLEALVDAGQFEQVVSNLLSNAIKFSPRGGRIEVRAQRLGSQAAVTIKDHGKGIAQHELPQIFQRFNRAHKRKPGAAGGTGLGLSIAKELVEGHGGRIWAESARGQGSAFHFTLPLAGR